MITLFVIEADDDEREKRHVQLGELYRTHLGHIRHEIGHYFWNRLVENTDRIQVFRRLFSRFDDRKYEWAKVKSKKMSTHFRYITHRPQDANYMRGNGLLSKRN